MEVAHKVDSPDSTTKEKPVFTEGEEVLVKMKEGRYFLGTVNQVSSYLNMKNKIISLQFNLIHN